MFCAFEREGGGEGEKEGGREGRREGEEREREERRVIDVSPFLGVSVEVGCGL